MHRSPLLKLFALGMVVFVIFFLSHSCILVYASEPSLLEIFNYLGFTNVTEIAVETFPLGIYNITLYAEFATYANENELSYYEVGTSRFDVVFTGPEGGFGYVPVPITNTFKAPYQFGLSMLSYGRRYFSEVSRNPNGTQYAKVYKNLDDLSMFLIGFDERTYCDVGGDGDYNDMVFSLQMQYHLTVISAYSIPSGEGWYYNGTNAFASLSDNIVDHGNGTRRVFTFWSGDASGTNHSKSEPIFMNQNKTAIANWQTQYYLTVNSPYGTPIGAGWYDAGSTAKASLDTNVVDHGNGTRRVFTFWSGDASGTNYAQSDPILMNLPKTAVANWKTQYRLIIRTNGLGSRVTNVYNGASILGTATDATPFVGWFDPGTLIQLNIDSPISEASTRYIFTQWTGDASGLNRPVSLTINLPKDITANYKNQYLLTVLTNPLGLSPQPTRNPAGEAGPANSSWYDAAIDVTLMGQSVTGYIFNYWDVDGTSKGTGVNPIIVNMNAPHTATAHYARITPLSVSINPTTAKIKIGESVTFVSSVSGGVTPYRYQWYLNGSTVSGANASSWTFSPSSLQPTGTYTVYLVVTDSLASTAKSNEAQVTLAPQLVVSISPTSASVLVGQIVQFTSTVSGGYPPYSYQWYVGGSPVSNATASTWTFTRAFSGIYYVYLKVTDNNTNVVQSEIAKITVSSAPVGGYSVSLSKMVSSIQLIDCMLLAVLLGLISRLSRRKRK